MSEALSSLTFSDEKDIGIKMMERLERLSSDKTKDDVQDELVGEIVSTH